MFKHGFPPEWSTFKKLIWLVGSGIAGASYIWKTVTGTLIHITDALASPVKELSVAIEPFQSGSGDPSPTNVRPITGWTGCNLYQASTINRFTTEGETTGKYLKTGNSIGSGSAWNYSDYIPVMPNRQYTFNPNSQDGDTAKSIFYDSTKAYISYIASGKQTFTTPSNCYYMRFSYRVVSTNIQLEMNSTDSEYEAYSVPTTYPISWQTEAGTVFKGTLDVLSGKLTVTWIQKIFTGASSEAWEAGSSQRFYIKVSPQTLYYRSSPNYIKSNMLPNIAAGSSGGNKNSCFVNAKNEIGISVYNITTLADLRQFLSENNLQIIYYLATPVEYQLTPTEVSTLAGENNIWADCGDTTLTYQAVPETAFSDETDKGMADYMTLTE